MLYIQQFQSMVAKEIAILRTRTTWNLERFCLLITVKTKVFTAHHFVPIHTLFLFLVCVLGQFSVQYTLSFLQCS